MNSIFTHCHKIYNGKSENTGFQCLQNVSKIIYQLVLDLSITARGFAVLCLKIERG